MRRLSFNNFFRKVICVLAILLLSTQTIANSKEANILFDFIGNWHSNADAFGQPAKSTLIFSGQLNDQFVQINLKIVSTASKKQQTIFSGVGYYKQLDKDHLKGFWADSGGDLLPISATFKNNELLTYWGEKGKKYGRSSYQLTENNKLIVTDSIFKNNQWHQFNQNTYTKK